MTGSLPSGVVDAGFASMGTFAAGLAAVNLLSDTDRGVYGVFFAAFIVGTTFPHNLVYLPSQVYAVGQALPDRLRYMGRVLAVGIGFSLLGSLAILLAAIATFSETTMNVTIALTLTAGSALVVSAAQDNLRRMLHIAELHWSAATMSIVQFVTVAVVLLALMAASVPVEWIPFGSLLVANVVSSTFGLIRAGGWGAWHAPKALEPRRLVSSGRWLLAQALIPTGAAFLAATIITWLAGAEAMGYAESARVVAQPVLVLGTGLTAVLGPRVMASAMSRQDGVSRAMTKRFAQLVVVAGVVYLGVAGWEAPWNPMPYIVPSAYVVSGLVVATIIANIAYGSLFLRAEELMGAHREVDLTKVSSVASPLLVAASFTAGLTGPFARPFGILVQAAARFGMLDYYRDRFYRAATDGPADLAADENA